MNKKRVAINGFGRIGRILTRLLLTQESIELVAINDLAPSDILAYLLKYDSTHRTLDAQITLKKNYLEINNHLVRILNTPHPRQLPWKDLNIDIVIESTGHFKSKQLAYQHIEAGAKRCIISAPPTSNDVKTIVLGVNEDILTSEDIILSNASCTTNCLAPMIKILNSQVKIEQAIFHTVHAYTGAQKLQDGPHTLDFRRARAAAQNIVPTSTSAAKIIKQIFPQISAPISGYATRVPVINASFTELICTLNKKTSIEQIHTWFKQASKGGMKDIIEYNTDEIVSSDILGNAHSCIFDASLSIQTGDLIKIVGWYDNEMGYSNRLIDLIKKIPLL